jgi:FG-GAP repeat
MHGHLARRAFACLFGSLLLGMTAAHAQQFTFPSQGVSYSDTLDNPEAGSPTGFGDSVGIEGLTMLAGIPFYGPNNQYGFPTGQGRVAVFTADAATGEVWTRTGSIENPNPPEGGGFGQALVLQHDRVIVEALSTLYAFDKHGTGAAQTWDLRATINLPAPVTDNAPPVTATEFEFGALAYDDGVAATEVTEMNDVNGAWQYSTFVYLYEVGRDGHTRLLDKLTRPPGSASTTAPILGVGGGCAFGASLALDADTLVVGCPAGTGPVTQAYPPGAAYVYSRRGDHWELHQTLAGTTAVGAEFGASVAIHKDVILVGAPDEDVDVDSNFNLLGAGAGYVYLRKRDRECDTWTLSQRIRPTPSLDMPYGGLGATVAFNDQYAAFAAPGSTQQGEPGLGMTLLYKWQGDQLVYDVEAPYGTNGTSMAMDRKRLVIGTDADFLPFAFEEAALIIDLDPKTTTSP